MSEIEKMREQELDAVSGGSQSYSDGWRMVVGLKGSYLAMRTEPYYNRYNEIIGSELYNGFRVQLKGPMVTGRDGKTYVQVYSPHSKCTGYVNASFLGWY